MLRDECSQQRWEALISTRFLKEDAVQLIADEVWPEIDGDDELENDDDSDHPDMCHVLE